MSYEKAAQIRKHPRSEFRFERLPDFGMKCPLKPFQVQGMFFLKEAKKCILADSTGLGKTAQCVSLFQWLEHKGVPDNKWILVVPPTTILQWASEFEKFTTLPEPVLGIHGRKSRVANYVHGFWQFMIMSYQILQRDWEYLYDLNVRNWVFDDAHFFRHHDTKTANIVKRLTRFADRVIMATATPMQKDPRDLHSLLEALGMNRYFGSLTGFTNRYCILQTTRHKKKDGRVFWTEEFVGIRHRDELKRKIRPFILKRGFKDVGEELPDVQVSPTFLQMSKKQSDMYDQLRKKIIKAYDAGRMSNTEILNTGFHTMRKICNGTRAVGMVEDHSVKLDAVMHFIQNRLGAEKLLIYTFYKENVRTLSKRLTDAGITSFATFTGDDSSREYREDVKRRFLDQKSKLKIIIGTDAIRVGINLQAARYLIMLDLIMNAQEMTQLVGRLRRIGSVHHKIVVYPLITRGTIEESLYRSLHYESALFDELFDERSDIFPKLSAVQLATLLRK